MLDDWALFAVVGAWMEADIIGATVRNAFAHGVERVLLVDNDSPDDTVAVAEAAGAECLLRFRTDRFEERYRYELLNSMVHHVSRVSGHQFVWWLWIDADEFPRPQNGGTIHELLQRLDRRFRIVGGRFVNHYPSPGVPYVEGTHPLDAQPLCEEYRDDFCMLGHRKHPLQRWDRNGPDISAETGFHRAISTQRPLLEPLDPLVIHHFPFRNEDATRRRMTALWGDESDSSRAKLGDFSTDHMEARLRSLDAVYRGDWAQVHDLYARNGPQGVVVRDWRELEPRMSTDVRRW